MPSFVWTNPHSQNFVPRHRTERSIFDGSTQRSRRVAVTWLRESGSNCMSAAKMASEIVAASTQADRRTRMNEPIIAGGCLCGAVTYEIAPPFQKLVHCHCSRCRKSSGTGHATNLIVDPSQFDWRSGHESISRYDLSAAESCGTWFCRCCGCPVPRLSLSVKMVVPAGSLDIAPPIRPTDHIFWPSRAPRSCSNRGLPTHDEYPDSR
jgi:hypothetical protein